ncbi:MAG: hypothetical protein KF745_14910 [Phycisphaeraceae bacterium]|nr:hypothetical protein [Phycisphaeraceae bacterium]
MAKSPTKSKKSSAGSRAKSKPAPAEPVHPSVHEIGRVVAAGRTVAGNRVDGAATTALADAGTGAPASAGSTIVPRVNVGAAVQAAISFENAAQVMAQATDDTRQMFSVSWG